MGAGTFEVALMDTLEDFTEQEERTLFEIIKEGGKQAKRDVADLSPKGKGAGEYKQGWAMRTKRGKGTIEVTIYNRTQPSLTYLLEHGHIIRNKYGTQNRKDGGGSRTTPRPHISTARDKAETYILKELKKEL